MMGNLINCINMTTSDSGIIKKLSGKGINTIRYYVGETTNGNTFSIADILPVAKEAVSLGINWIMHIDMRNIITSDGSPVPTEARMFIRASERKTFEFVLKNLQMLKSENALPSIVEIDCEMNVIFPEVKLGSEDEKRVLNAAINGAKAENPDMKVMFYLSSGLDNEACKKPVNRFFVAGGRPFEYLSVDFTGKGLSDLYTLSQNISDLSRRFEKDIIIVETSDTCDDELSDVLIQSLAAVPLERGLGVIFSDKTVC